MGTSTGAGDWDRGRGDPGWKSRREQETQDQEREFAPSTLCVALVCANASATQQVCAHEGGCMDEEEGVSRAGVSYSCRIYHFF